MMKAPDNIIICKSLHPVSLAAAFLNVLLLWEARAAVLVQAVTTTYGTATYSQSLAVTFAKPQNTWRIAYQQINLFRYIASEVEFAICMAVLVDPELSDASAAEILHPFKGG